MAGAYMAIGVSGAHLNPASRCRWPCDAAFPWSKVAPYMVAQLAGAFVASARRLHHLLRSAEPLRRWRAPGLWCARHGRHLGDVPEAVRVGVSWRLHRSGRGHRPPHGGHLRDHGSAERPRASRSRAGPRRAARRAHRRDLWLQHRLRDQPRARFRSASVHRDGWVARGGLHRRWRLVVGADRGALHRWRCRRPTRTISVSANTSRRRPTRRSPNSEPFHPRPRPGHDLEPRDRLSS